MARFAAQGRAGLAQGIFQVGGQVGGAVAPLAAALIIVPMGQTSMVVFALAPVLAMGLLLRMASQSSNNASDDISGAGNSIVNKRHLLVNKQATDR